jgi:hypothetical protein
MYLFHLKRSEMDMKNDNELSKLNEVLTPIIVVMCNVISSLGHISTHLVGNI